MKRLTKYDKQQVEKIKSWKAEKPSVFKGELEGPDTLTQQALWLAEQVLPETYKPSSGELESMLKDAFDKAYAAAEWLADSDDIKEEAKVLDLKALRTKNLQLCDRLADGIQHWSTGLAAAEGAATGVGGFLTMGMDIPALVTLLLGTIYKMGMCYGYKASREAHKRVFAIILLACLADTNEEKQLLLKAMNKLLDLIVKKTWEGLPATSVTQTIKIAGFEVSGESLVTYMGNHLLEREGLQAVPGVGALVGAGMNSWYAHQFGRTARYFFQELWLLENGKLGETLTVKASSA